MNCTTAKCKIEEWYNEHLTRERVENKQPYKKKKMKKKRSLTGLPEEKQLFTMEKSPTLSAHQIKYGKQWKKKKGIPVCFPASQCPVKISA